MLLHNVHGFDVVVNCTVRPQIPNPTVQSLQQANKDAYNMRLRVAQPLNPGSNQQRDLDNYQGCWNKSVSGYTAATRNASELDAMRFQGIYGHPRYCQERRQNILAQPQYGNLLGSVENYWPDISRINNSYEANNLPQTGTSLTTWYFKGFYFFGAPGRIGLRSGNPGYAMYGSNARIPIANGHTEYVKDLTANNSFDTGGDLNVYGCSASTPSACFGWDRDRSQGVWTECRVDNYRTAYAIFVGAGVWYERGTYNFSSTNNAFLPSCMFSSNSYSNGMYTQDPTKDGCTTCTGKWNYHTRTVVSQYDEGPNDPFADPYNPWSMTVSVRYPTYVDTSSFNAAAYNYSLANGLYDICKAYNGSYNCATATSFSNTQYTLDNKAGSGYSLSNYGGLYTGRYDELTVRGIHLHNPPENWGASFEPTRALVSSITYVAILLPRLGLTVFGLAAP